MTPFCLPSVGSSYLSKLLWIAWLATLAPLGAVCVAASAAGAAPTGAVERTAATVHLAQSTSIAELSDILPDDWAFQALQNIVENYGCLRGYGDRTFQGQRSLTRFEFAAGLNACLDVMAELASQIGVTPEDLATLTRLQEEFQSELRVLDTRITTLEAKTATLQTRCGRRVFRHSPQRISDDYPRHCLRRSKPAQ
jgi:hypothetical protein